MRYQAIAIIALALLLPSTVAAFESYSVQAATFSKEIRALRAAKALQSKGLSCDYVKIGELYKVYCGRFSSKSDAAAMRALVRAEGFRDAFYITTPSSGIIETTSARQTPPPDSEAKATQNESNAPIASSTIITRNIDATSQPADPLKQPQRKELSASESTPIKPMGAQAPSVAGRKPGETTSVTMSPPAPKVEQTIPQHKQPDKPKHDPKAEQKIDRITADIFERNNRHLHPFASASVIRNSNIYFSETDEVSDTVTLSTIGLWASLPALRSNIFEETTSNITPGGWELPAFYTPGDRHYQAYALYRADSERYANHSSLNFTGHNAQAHAEYNLRSGHSVLVDDIYNIAHDGMDVGIANSVNKYNSNLARFTLIFRPSPKTSLELEARSFDLSYDSDANSMKDRYDTLLRSSIDYKPLGKTSFGLEYARTNLDYDSPDRSDRTDVDILGRIKWDITGKSTGLFKVGTSKRKFEGGSEQPDTRLKVLGELSYKFSSKTSLGLKSWLYRNETDYSTADFVDVNKHIITMNWKLTGKTSLVIEDEYQQNEYIDKDPAPGASGSLRTDKFNDITIRAQTRMRDWVTIEAGYEHQTRSSTIEGSSYKTDFLYTSLSVAF